MAAEPERKCERSGADETVIAVRLQDVFRIAVGTRQHVTVEMHGALRLASGAGGERDQADVVDRSVAWRDSFIPRLRHQAFELALAPIDDLPQLACQGR